MSAHGVSRGSQGLPHVRHLIWNLLQQLLETSMQTHVCQASHLGKQYARDRDTQCLNSEQRSATWCARHSHSNTISEPAVTSYSDSSDLSSIPSNIMLPNAPMSSHVFDDDYVNLICKEIICLSLCSDTPRNPLISGYNMTLPLATYKESQLRSDALVW